MSYSYQPHTTNSSQVTYTFSFAGSDPGYISTEHLVVEVRSSGDSEFNTLDNARWYLSGTNQITLTPAIAAPADGKNNLRIRRVVPKEVPYASFPRGSMLDMLNLDRTFIQTLEAFQEFLDGFLPTGFYFQQNINMNGHKFTNLGPGTQSGDSINWDQWDDHEMRILAMETDLTALSSRTLPYYYIATGGEVRWDNIPFNFTSALMFINGVFQNQNLGAFSISDNGFNFPEPLIAGDEVYVLLGSHISDPDNHPTYSEVLEMFGGVDGANKIGYRATNVGSALTRLMTPADIGQPRPTWGRNPVGDQTIWDTQTECDLMHKGGLLLARKSRGIRQNATVLSVRANSEGGGGFTPQVAGSDDTAVLSAAGALDSVALFTDNYALAYAAWEDVATATYTATTCTITDPTTLANLKLGDFLKTKHGFSCIGLVTGISGNVVTVQKWVIWATSTVTTPADGIGLYVNPVDKIWGQNTNILFDANTRATRGAAVEYGVMNLGVPYFDNLTGVDVVILPQSTYGAGSGVRVRSPNVPARWKYGFEGGGANAYNVYMHDTGTLPSQVASFGEDTTSAVGFKFSGRNITSSISFTDVNTGLESANFTPWGHEGKGGRLTATLNSGGSPGAARRYLVNNASAMSVILPDPTNRKYGEDYEFVFVGTGAVTFTSAVGTVNGNPSVVITPATSFESRKSMVGGTTLWYLYK